MKKITIFLPSLVLSLFYSSCATYTMSREQLYTQISNATPEKVTTAHAFEIGSRTYFANGVKEIECSDKHGKVIKFPNSPQVEMKIIDTRKHGHLFYFDTVVLQDSTFTGLNSRILGTKKSIRYADIKIVKLQKGAKAYYYKRK